MTVIYSKIIEEQRVQYDHNLNDIADKGKCKCLRNICNVHDIRF